MYGRKALMEIGRAHLGCEVQLPKWPEAVAHRRGFAHTQKFLTQEVTGAGTWGVLTVRLWAKRGGRYAR